MYESHDSTEKSQFSRLQLMQKKSVSQLKDDNIKAVSLVDNRENISHKKLQPPLQRVHVHMSGSGVDAKDESLGNEFGKAYVAGGSKKDRVKRASYTLSGPGKGAESSFGEKILGEGTTQTESSQDERIINAVKLIGSEWLKGDREIVITGFSRGAGNVIEVARFIQKYGLLNEDGALIPGTKGAVVKYIVLLDPVPATPRPGYARTVKGVTEEDPLVDSIDSFTGVTKTSKPRAPNLSIEGEVVPYDKLKIPSNVQHVTSIFAHAETRGAFEAYRAKAEDPQKTSLLADVIPMSVHSQVGGTSYGGTRSNGARLALDTMISSGMDIGIRFGNATRLTPRSRQILISQLLKDPRAAEDFTTRVLTQLKPMLRKFGREEQGPIAREFMRQLSSASRPDQLAPLFEQFNMTQNYVSSPLVARPDQYLAALPSRANSSQSSALMPSSGGALPLSAALAMSIPGLILFIVALIVVIKMFKRR